MNKFGRAREPHLKTIKLLQEAKTELVLLSNRQRFHISELTQHSLNSLGGPWWHFQKAVNVHPAILRKMPFENLVSSQFSCKFSLFHVQRPDCSR